MYNRVVLVGNLTRDIELKYSQSGMGIANTAIATSRKFTSNGEKKEEVMFIDLTFFGRSAEIANQYLRKGSKILVEGRLNFDQWVDQNGAKRSKHSVTVDIMQMLDSRADAQNMAQSGGMDGGYTPPVQNNSGGYNPPPAQNQGYNAPMQQQQQMPQNQGYNAPQQNNQYNAPVQNQQIKMPEQSMPEIDIDDDEIPF